MLRAFSRLRSEHMTERRFGSYLRYAQGEILGLIQGYYL